jgi:predicted adenylyl cyclase CyaB
MQNKLNLELKYFCKDFVGVRKTLKEIGAKKIIVKVQKDYFFNLPLKQTNPRLKLRTEGKNQTLVYYERPNFEENQANPAKVILLPVKDIKLMMFLSETLGIKTVVVKKRELWKKGKTIFNLDTVEGVGKIFEIEVTTNDKNKKADEKTFNKYKDQFKPHLTKIIKGSNLDLVSKTKT